MGNVAGDAGRQGQVQAGRPAARALKSVEGLFDLKGYPSPYSDVVALMVLAHQTRMTNLLTRVGWEARLVAAASEARDAAARVRAAAVDLVDYMLFVDEAPLTGRR